MKIHTFNESDNNMFTLLKKVRRKLISNSSFASYLLYAIGEIALVVIGILIALQVNNWNQNRKEGIEENKALQNLKEDFEYNQITLQNAIDRLKVQMLNSVNILENTGNKYSSTIDSQLDSFLISATSTPRYFPQTGFLNDLMSSGQLSLIQNETLRNQLSSWPTHMQLIRDRTDANHNHSMVLMELVSKYGNWLRVDSKYPLKNIQLPPSGFKKTNVPLLQMAEFESLMDIQVVFKDELLNRLISTMKVCEEILVLIEEELDR